MIYPSERLIPHVHFENFVETHFTRVKSSAEQLELAQIFLLGECHLEENHRLKNGWIIQHLYQEGDVVLIEAPDEIAALNKNQVRFVKKEITLHGWDTPLLIEINPWRHRKTIIKILALIHKVQISKTVEKKQLTQAAIQLQSFRPKNTITHKELGIQWIDFEVDKDPNNLEDFNKIVKKVSSVWFQYINSEIFSTFEIRQKCLICSISKHLTDSNKVFVIAGISHFNHDDPAFSDHPYSESIINGIEILTNYLEDKSFILLFPNENEEDIPFLRRKLMSKITRIKTAYNETMSAYFTRTPILNSLYNYFQSKISYEKHLNRLDNYQLIDQLGDLSEESLHGTDY